MGDNYIKNLRNLTLALLLAVITLIGYTVYKNMWNLGNRDKKNHPLLFKFNNNLITDETGKVKNWVFEEFKLIDNGIKNTSSNKDNSIEEKVGHFSQLFVYEEDDVNSKYYDPKNAAMFIRFNWEIKKRMYTSGYAIAINTYNGEASYIPVEKEINMLNIPNKLLDRENILKFFKSGKTSEGVVYTLRFMYKNYLNDFGSEKELLEKVKDVKVDLKQYPPSKEETERNSKNEYIYAILFFIFASVLATIVNYWSKEKKKSEFIDNIESNSIE